MRLFFYLFLMKNPAIHTELTPSSLLNNIDGYDMRNISINEEDSLLELTQYYKNKYLVDKLESNNISINEKLNIIEINDVFNKKYVDLLAGGLMDDFDFKFHPHE